MFKRAIPAAAAAIGALAVAAMTVLPSTSATAAPKAAPAATARAVTAQPTAVTVPQPHAVPETSGTKCADGYGFPTSYHICAVVHGTGLTVLYVNATVNGDPSWCGYILVATTIGNFRSPYGCTGSGDTYSKTVTVNGVYPRSGPLDVWAMNANGTPTWANPDGFEIS